MTENKADPLREALSDIESWRFDTLGPRPKDTDPIACATEITEAFDRGARMAFHRCAERAKAALAAPQPAAPLGGREALARIIYSYEYGYEPDEYQIKRSNPGKKCLGIADAILSAIPQELGVERAAIIEECALRLDESATYEDRHIEVVKKDRGLSITGRESLIEHAVTRRTAFRQGASSIRHLRALAGKETGR